MDAAERTRLIEDHQGYVHRLARTAYEQVGRNVSFEDLVGFGLQGLTEAAQRYDPSLGTRFVTFAHYRIRGAIYDGIRNMSRLPKTELRKLARLRKMEGYLEHEGERAAAARLPGARPEAAGSGAKGVLRDMYEALRAATTIHVATLEDEEELEAEQFDPSEQLRQRQLHQRVREVVHALPERERAIIEKCYFEDMTMVEAGAALGLSRSWTSRLHARAIDRLRKRLNEGGRAPDDP